MNKDNSLVLDFATNITFRNRYSIIVYLFLIIFYTISLLFSFYIFQFNDKFIDKLQSVYPYTYVYSKSDIKLLNNEVKVYKEIFEINFEELEYKFNDDSSSMLFKNIGLRSFDKENIPLSVFNYKNNIDEDVNIIYVDQILYKKLINSKNYKNGIYIKYINSNKFYFVKVKPIEVFDTSKWILMENTLAKKIFINDYFDKNVLVSKDNDLLYSIYKERYPNTYLWSDSLSFFGIVFYKLSDKFYTIYNFSFTIMICLFIFVTLKGLLKEFKKMTLFASRFGKSLFSIFMIYTGVLMVYFNSMIFISFGLAFFCTIYINDILFFSDILQFPFFVFIVLNFFILLLTSIFVYYYGVYFDRAKYV